jgi:hypothetical protein
MLKPSNKIRDMSKSNPHALPQGFKYYTLCPFKAMSAAASLGASVDRYTLQGFGHSVDPARRNFFGYAVYGRNGAIAINYQTREYIEC